ncbi:unnamed protein product [Rotaria sordida]|uniref:Uncharacterized protein n=1 Tax=Rotaria sordida TaxID=392033 RepID=A0A814HRB8_9BILA|nr:unnamed protein product [Rotaria sordida]CAF1114174.1 unnamed protein product [Rotaria sordida]
MKNAETQHTNEQGEHGFVTNQRQSKRQSKRQPATTIHDLAFTDDIALFETRDKQSTIRQTMTELRDNYEKAQRKLERADANLKKRCQLYRLEKFWAFLIYSRQKPKIHPKLEEILKDYKNLEDLHVDDASFPQQFFPKKSNYTPEAIAVAVAKNSDTSNSLKLNGKQYLNGAKLYTRFVFLLFCLK